MKVAEIEVAGNNCPIVVGPIEEIRSPGPIAFVITDENVEKAQGARLRLDGPRFTFPAGEAAKNGDTWQRCCSWLAANGADRSSVVVAFGGGVTTDIGGFAAATYMRGIPWIAVPTSLMGQVDAAIGGKTGLDLDQGKNLVGSFHQPNMVWCDPAALQTLPEEHLRYGAAEIVKYGFISEPALLKTVADEREAILARDQKTLTDIVATCASIKARIVNEDPFERKGKRAILNFGHTVGHALEQASSYSMHHGEAVARGMLVESLLGVKLGITDEAIPNYLREFISAYQLDIHPMPRVEAVCASMSRDKKATLGRLTFALVEQPGVSRLASDVDESLIREVLTGK
jgi:3-dehydroquinate synthase